MLVLRSQVDSHRCEHEQQETGTQTAHKKKDQPKIEHHQVCEHLTGSHLVTMLKCKQNEVLEKAHKIRKNLIFSMHCPEKN